MIMLYLSTYKEAQHKSKILKINWFNYTRETLCIVLAKEDWNINTKNTQEYYNIFENKLVKIVDRIAPFKAHQFSCTKHHVGNNVIKRQSFIQ